MIEDKFDKKAALASVIDALPKARDHRDQLAAQFQDLTVQREGLANRHSRLIGGDGQKMGDKPTGGFLVVVESAARALMAGGTLDTTGISKLEAEVAEIRRKVWVLNHAIGILEPELVRAREQYDWLCNQHTELQAGPRQHLVGWVPPR